MAARFFGARWRTALAGPAPLCVLGSLLARVAASQAGQGAEAG
jgi:hypothetical protein